MSSKSKRFQRTKSTTQTRYLSSRKPSFHQQQMEQLSRSTIIPFVNTRFEVISKFEKSHKSQTLIIQKQTKGDRNLACFVIFYRVSKMMKSIAGYQTFYHLKTLMLKDKIQQLFERKHIQNKRLGFNSIKQGCKYGEKYYCKLLRQIDHRKSIGFRKIFFTAMSSPQKIIYRTNPKLLDEQKQQKQKNKMPMSRVNFQYSQIKQQTAARPRTNSNLVSSPPTLKPDKYQINRNQTIWRVLPHY